MYMPFFFSTLKGSGILGPVYTTDTFWRATLRKITEFNKCASPLLINSITQNLP